MIGMADGLTVPFALAAGLTGAVDASHIIIVAGLAEIAAGSIAMGLGGYLAARSEGDQYAAGHKREERGMAGQHRLAAAGSGTLVASGPAWPLGSGLPVF